MADRYDRSARSRVSDKPFSASCERNRDPILGVLRIHFADRRRVLEIGSGTGQHAAHFAAALPRLTWQTSDRLQNIPGIRAWLDDAALPNTPAPLPLDVNSGPWPATRFDAIFSANALHIMGWPEVQQLFARLPQLTSADAKLVIYGPFKIAGRFTSDSNEAFDRSLRKTDPDMGIRDAEAVDALAEAAGFGLLVDLDMPANNLCRIWGRRA